MITFKGWRGFIFVGSYILPLIIMIGVTWLAFKSHNYMAGWMSILACYYNIMLFLSNIHLASWMHMSNVYEFTGNTYAKVLNIAYEFIKERNLSNDFESFLKKEVDVIRIEDKPV